MLNKRVVVTGIGIIAPNGMDKETYWENCNKGKSFVVQDQEMVNLNFKSTTLARINDFDLTQYVKLREYPELEELDLFVQYGVAASEQAIEDSKLYSDPNKEYGDKISIIFSSAIGGTPYIVKIFEDLTAKGKQDLVYKTIGSKFYNSGMFNYPSALVSKKYGFAGICTSLTTGCTAGLDALGTGFEYILQGDADIVLVGASEAPLSPLTYATLDVINSLSRYDGNPAESSRPFDAKRSGFVISEGAVVFVLEELNHALKRNAPIYAEVKSYCSFSNSFHMTDLPEDGLAMARVLKKAMEDANCKPKDIQYVNAHGSSTPQNDLFETAAYKLAFGAEAYNIPISSVKSMIGHSLSSASLMGTLSIIGAINNSVIHPTINYKYADEQCDLDYVPNVARQKEVNLGVVTASGFGGIHSAAILQKFKG